MKKTQVRLPDVLYHRAKRFAVEREMSLAEVTRRALEGWLDRYSRQSENAAEWRFPVANSGGVKLSTGQISDLLSDEETFRSFPHEDEGGS